MTMYYQFRTKYFLQNIASKYFSGVRSEYSALFYAVVKMNIFMFVVVAFLFFHSFNGTLLLSRSRSMAV
jgi:hypothetical protein